ncbi:hypothetical protein JMF89_07030 [Clostridiaceae bacterium UIB06]|uniref:Uncharacterized protein n=1 Tax=Clostridium thailandense TaxID=2794346 RepID=A0A949THN6_9CLOT|nr:hypothetical protein [Clostridium thailandense]MBV7272430.1 hypothetical protein [Clostridium thailandense]MCH5136954.1 hypothetical protein [Clostridiaceae bacterium UIB06]
MSEEKNVNIGPENAKKLADHELDQIVGGSIYERTDLGEDGHYYTSGCDYHMPNGWCSHYLRDPKKEPYILGDYKYYCIACQHLVKTRL